MCHHRERLGRVVVGKLPLSRKDEGPWAGRRCPDPCPGGHRWLEAPAGSLGAQASHAGLLQKWTFLKDHSRAVVGHRWHVVVPGYYLLLTLVESMSVPSGVFFLLRAFAACSRALASRIQNGRRYVPMSRVKNCPRLPGKIRSR